VKHLLLVTVVILLVAYPQVMRIDLPYLSARLDVHQAILDKSAEAPYLQRVLVVWVAEAAADLLPGNHLINVSLMHIAIGLLALAALFISTDVLLRRFFSAQQALIGVLLLGLSFNVTTFFYSDVPHYSLVEAAILVWGLVCVEHIFFSLSWSSSGRSTETPPAS
jgi:hypothetical protein